MQNLSKNKVKIFFMNNIGISLFLITTISILLIFIFHKKTKKIFSSYWFYLVFSILYFSYFVVFRYADNIKDFFESGNLQELKNSDPYWYSFSFSKILLLDICPLMTMLIPVALIIDKTRNIAKVLSLFGLLGGILTIYGSMIFIKEINVSLTLFIFVGESPNYLMFSSHFLTLILSLLVILNSKKFTKWSVMGAFLFFFTFIAYALITSNLLDIKCNVTGLQPGDWYNPYPNKFWYSQYAYLYKATNFNFLANIFLWYSVGAIIIFVFIFLKNIMVKDPNLLDNKIWWHKLSEIDNWINNKSTNIEKFFKSQKKIHDFKI